MKDTETVEIAAHILQEHGLPVYIYRRKTGLSCLVIAGFKRCKQYVDAFEPLLTGEKYTACRIMREFIELRLSRPKHGDIPLDERVLIQRLRDHNAPTQNKRKVPLPLS